AAYRSGAVSPNSLATLVGSGMNTSGLTVTLIDSTGAERAATVLNASADQINYLVPEATAAGPAVALIASNSRIVAAANMEVTPAAPALFTATNDVAAAVVQRIRGDG